MKHDLPTERIRDASRRLVRELGFLRPTLAGTELSPSAVHALVEIGARPAMTAAGLAEILVLDKSSVSRMLRKLIASGELVEGVSTRDARAKPLSLTPQGRATLARIDDFARRQVLAALKHMAPDSPPRLAESLAGYADALAAARRR
jgi:DNA-binding MarR family transcriptional regulator